MRKSALHARVRSPVLYRVSGTATTGHLLARRQLAKRLSVARSGLLGTLGLVLIHAIDSRRCMSELSERTRTKLDLVLEETCRTLPHGGDHAAREFVARRLLEAAQRGHVTRGELGIIARRALADLVESRR